MRRHRGVLFLAGLLTTGALVGVGVIARDRLQPWLSPPQAADRGQLVAWLVTRDLSAEPLETRRALARRLEEEFRGDVDWEATGRTLSPAQRRRLWHNLPGLLEPWLSDKVDGYFGLSEQQRPAYIDQIIDTIGQWRGVDVLRPETIAGDQLSEETPGLTAVLHQRIKAMKEQAGPDRRERMSRFLAALQTRWFFRAFEGVLPERR